MFVTKNYSHTWQWRTVLLCFVVSTLAGGKINRITNSKQKVGLDINLYFGGIWYFAELQTCLTGRLNYPFGKKLFTVFWQLNSTKLLWFAFIRFLDFTDRNGYLQTNCHFELSTFSICEIQLVKGEGGDSSCQIQ